MTHRRKHNGRETTVNSGVFVVRYRWTAGANTRTTREFTSRDRRQAYREAGKHARRGRLISFMRHAGAGQVEDLTSTVRGGEGQ
ncbi:MAG: hypothetical protein HOY75_09720 [Streptomyces sp.]|nr:hypothetical protein [Streptomyces sp.]